MATVIFSTHLPMELDDKRSRHAGAVSLREIAELTHHASMFVGCGSGGSVAASSTSSRNLPMVQILSKSASVFASFAHDFEYFGLTDRTVVEITDEDPRTIARCIATVCTEGFEATRRQFEERVPVTFAHYVRQIREFLLKPHRTLDAARSLLITAERYGWAPELVDFGKAEIAGNLQYDPTWIFPDNRRRADRFLTELEAAGPGQRRAKQRLWAEGSACQGEP